MYIQMFSQLYPFLQCYTSAGVPFYMNSMEAIVKMAVGNPDISRRIARYPVVPKHFVR